MTSRERVLTSRLISRIEKNKQFADDIVLSYTIREAHMAANCTKQAQHQNLKNNEKTKSFKGDQK